MTDAPHVNALLDRGDAVAAFDAAERALQDAPDDPRLRWLAVLALARAGSTAEARRRYAALRVADIAADPLAPDALRRDAASLGARLAKGRALRAALADRPALLSAAARLYEDAHDRWPDHYPAVNAATLHAMAGDAEAARRWARVTLEALAAAPPDTLEGERFWRAASAMEAHLILGERDEAATAAARAATLDRGNLGARAAALRQIRRLCAALGLDDGLLAPLIPPRVLSYTGHIIAAPGAEGRFPAALEDKVAAEISRRLDARPAAAVYGSLAAGADILIAETALARGAALHVVLPFAEDEFARTSVASSGGDWRARYRRCLDGATSRRVLSPDRYLGDDSLFRAASRHAMGLATLRAQHIGAITEQLGVWDGGPSAGVGGAADEIAFWRGLGRPSEIVAIPRRETPPRAAAGRPHGREMRAILFGDFKGFSRLSDAQIGAFARHALGAVAAEIGAAGQAVTHRNTWGDGLFVVFREALDAALCAQRILRRLERLDLVAVGLPEALALRLGAHFGAAFERDDPVRGGPNCFGAAVSRAARLEPIAPPGALIATEEFAAALAIETERAPRMAYVGRLPLAKNAGFAPVYAIEDGPGEEP